MYLDDLPGCTKICCHKVCGVRTEDEQIFAKAYMARDNTKYEGAYRHPVRVTVSKRKTRLFRYMSEVDWTESARSRIRWPLYGLAR